MKTLKYLSATKRSLLFGGVFFALLLWNDVYRWCPGDEYFIALQAAALVLILFLARMCHTALALFCLAFVVQAALYIPQHNSLGNSVPFGEIVLMQSSFVLGLLAIFRPRE